MFFFFPLFYKTDGHIGSFGVSEGHEAAHAIGSAEAATALDGSSTQADFVETSVWEVLAESVAAVPSPVLRGFERYIGGRLNQLKPWPKAGQASEDVGKFAAALYRQYERRLEHAMHSPPQGSCCGPKYKAGGVNYD